LTRSGGEALLDDGFRRLAQVVVTTSATSRLTIDTPAADWFSAFPRTSAAKCWVLAVVEDDERV
jgi:hypothetical protein